MFFFSSFLFFSALPSYNLASGIDPQLQRLIKTSSRAAVERNTFESLISPSSASPLLSSILFQPPSPRPIQMSRPRTSSRSAPPPRRQTSCALTCDCVPCIIRCAEGRREEGEGERNPDASCHESEEWRQSCGRSASRQTSSFGGVFWGFFFKAEKQVKGTEWPRKFQPATRKQLAAATPFGFCLRFTGVKPPLWCRGL